MQRVDHFVQWEGEVWFRSAKIGKMSSSSDEFDYGLVNTDEIEIQPFQFERLSGASKRGRRGARSRKRRRPNSAVLVQGTENA